MKRTILAAILLGTALGCAPALAGPRVYVRVIPPAPVEQVRVAAPGKGYVWVGGFHRWDGRAYVWVPGRWALPPRPRAVWVPGHWKHTAQGWYWIEGRWK